MDDFRFDDQGTATSAAVPAAVTPVEGFTLTVERGPSTGATFAIDGAGPQAIIVGQSPLCPIRLSDPTVSRRHASLEVVADKLRVRDLGSTNGTFVGPVQVTDALATTGQTITLGDTVLRVGAAAAPAERLPIADRFGDAVGTSVAMRRLFPLLARLATTTIPVLIEGETGTGKEAVAESLHRQGPRRDKPFVVFDCTAVATNLIESELFGHERGAFTGAASRRRGVFEQAHGGTLFIDELGDLPLESQAKLLRAIDTGQVRRVGSEAWIRCDARIIAATRRDLEQRIVEGQFRDDLFHRLAIGRVALPPLRERHGDVPLLVEHFCDLLGVSARSVPPALLASWNREPWPGNVRELRNAVTRHVTLGSLASPAGAHDAALDASDDLAPGAAFEQLLAALAPHDEARQQMLALFHRHYTERMLAAHDGQVQRAAEASGVALRYFQLLRSRAKKE